MYVQNPPIEMIMFLQEPMDFHRFLSSLIAPRGLLKVPQFLRNSSQEVPGSWSTHPIHIVK